MVKVVKYGVCILNDDIHSFEYVADILRETFAWDITQAMNCVLVIHNKGEYVVRWYDKDTDALIIAEYFRSVGLKTKIIIDKNVDLS